MVKLSKSKVKQYTQCPYSFYLQYIKQVELPKIPAAMERGTEIHSLIESFYSRETLEEASERLRLNPKYVVYKDAMENIISFAVKTGKNSRLIKPLMQEAQLYDAELDFSGIVDAVFKDGDDVLLIDWKTGQTHPIEDYRFELAMYSHLVCKEKKIMPSHWGIFFVDANQLIVEKSNSLMMDESITLIKETRKKIDNKEFDKKPGWYCKWCVMKLNKHCEGVK